MPDKKEIIKLLEEIADMMEFKGENTFKIGAYRNGANAIRRSESDFQELIDAKKLNDVKGIGKGLQSVIYEYCEKGVSTLYDELRMEVPPGVGELLKVKGLGPRKIRTLYDELQITTLDELESAAQEGKLLSVKGFTQSAIEKMLEGIEYVRKTRHLIMLSTGIKYSEEMVERFSNHDQIFKFEPTGELRRRREVFSSLEFAALVCNKKEFISSLKESLSVEIENDNLILPDLYEVPTIIYLTEKETEFSKLLFTTTGSDEFIEKYLSGVSKGSTEEEIFKSAGKDFVIPEMREEEFFSLKNKKLQKNSDLHFDNFHGLLHWHTTYSDGRATLEDMLSEAEKLKFNYIAVCDHSKAAAYAGGLSEAKIFSQTEHLKRLKSKSDLTLFQGIESDILQEGDLDYSDEFLKNIDFVVASIHSRFSMDEKEMTKRIIKAVENPYTDVLAHPSGRLLLSRESYKFDVKKVIDACAANLVAIEINSNPRRLDLDWRYLYYAREKGCLFTINPDAHSTAEIYLLEFGIMMGRKSGMQSSEVINCYDLQAFKQFLNRKVKRNFVVYD